MIADLPPPPMPPMRGSSIEPGTARPVVLAPWKEMLFEAVVEKAHTAQHCFSVCLYHEPQYGRRFPERDFSERYLSRVDDIRTFLEQHDWHLKIFADTPMLSTALSLGLGDVYHVPTPPAFPFAQHLYRYYAALLTQHGTIQAYHFRGLDNLLLSDDELRIADLLVSQKLDLEHRPYLRRKGGHYTPVRGSFSVANEGIASLAWWLRTQRHTMPREAWPALWHSDELYLERWFYTTRQQLRLLTVVDRELPLQFYADLQTQVASAQPFFLHRLP